MNTFHQTSDASHVYRETSALRAVRTNGTGDTGTLLQVMRDSVMLIGSPVAGENADGKITDWANGSLEAVSKR